MLSARAALAFACLLFSGPAFAQDNIGPGAPSGGISPFGQAILNAVVVTKACRQLSDYVLGDGQFFYCTAVCAPGQVGLQTYVNIERGRNPGAYVAGAQKFRRNFQPQARNRWGWTVAYYLNEARRTDVVLKLVCLPGEFLRGDGF